MHKNDTKQSVIMKAAETMQSTERWGPRFWKYANINKMHRNEQISDFKCLPSSKTGPKAMF
jgi:hypothetical protein